MTEEPMLGVFLSGVALLAILFVPLVVIEWRELKQWWRDVGGPLP